VNANIIASGNPGPKWIARTNVLRTGSTRGVVCILLLELHRLTKPFKTETERKVLQKQQQQQPTAQIGLEKFDA
jgi:hypothetical protein